MKDKQEFFETLAQLDEQPYRDYSRIMGDYDFGRYILRITRAPTDPSEGPLVFLVRVPASVSGYPPKLYASNIRRTALEDLLARKLAAAVERVSAYDESGIARRRLFAPRPGQKILPRSAVVVADDYIEARIAVRLPEREGLILAVEAQDVFFRQLPDVVSEALIYCNLDEQETALFVERMEDADAIRQMLPTRGMVAFIAEGSRLARSPSGDTPASDAQPLLVDEAVAAEFDAPNGGRIRGLGIRAGLTVVLGDMRSGRPELIRAIAAGIYN
ncbi:MAG: hypothetical protein N2444_09070, partial [Methylocystis sp.]|nr:hypothetical protein [Methylocystis sp.]